MKHRRGALDLGNDVVAWATLGMMAAIIGILFVGQPVLDLLSWLLGSMRSAAEAVKG